MNDVNSLSAYELELQIPYSICAEISSKSFLWTEAARNRGNIKNIVRMEESKHHRGGSVPGSHPYAGRDTSKVFGVELYGVS